MDQLQVTDEIMDQLSNDIDELISRMRRHERGFQQENEERILNMIEVDSRRPIMSPSDEALELIREGMAEDLNAINRMRDVMDDDLQGFAEGFQYLDEILKDIRNFADEADHAIDVDDDNGVIVIEDSDDEDPAVVIDVDVDGSEQEVDWDEFSVSAQSSDSGFYGSVSDISDVTSHSAFSDELVHNEVCHFGFLVRPEHVREPAPFLDEALPVISPHRIPQGMSQSDIHNWLQKADTATATGQKRKRYDSGEEADDSSQNVIGPKSKKLCKVVRQSKSDISVHTDDVLVKRSFSESVLLLC